MTLRGGRWAWVGPARGPSQHDLGSALHEPARGLTRYPLRGPWACHSQEILFQARIGTSPPRWPVGRTPLFFFLFSLKRSKIQKNNIKHGPWPQEARVRGQNLEISGPSRHDLHSRTWTRPVISPNPQAESLNKLGPANDQVLSLMTLLWRLITHVRNSKFGVCTTVPITMHIRRLCQMYGRPLSVSDKFIGPNGKSMTPFQVEAFDDEFPSLRVLVVQYQ